MTYHKRTESQLVTACLQYLQALENNKLIAYVDRLNSGRYRAGKYYVRGCRPGTADIYCRLNSGKTIWFEAKQEGKTVLEKSAQEEFKNRMIKAGDSYWVIHSVEEMESCLKVEGVKTNAV